MANSSPLLSLDVGLADFDLLTLADVAKLLHCSKGHVSKAIAGRLPGCPPIPAVCLGRRRLVRRASLLSWIERSEQAATPAMIPISPVRGAVKRA
jgi:excisionase family DNA binding protein